MQKATTRVLVLLTVLATVTATGLLNYMLLRSARYPSRQKQIITAATNKAVIRISPTAERIADEYEGWYTYTHPRFGFSLRYPPNWEVAELGKGYLCTDFSKPYAKDIANTTCYHLGLIADTDHGALNIFYGTTSEHAMLATRSFNKKEISVTDKIKFGERLISKHIMQERGTTWGAIYNDYRPVWFDDLGMTISYSSNTEELAVKLSDILIADKIVESFSLKH